MKLSDPVNIYSVSQRIWAITQIYEYKCAGHRDFDYVMWKARGDTCGVDCRKSACVTRLRNIPSKSQTLFVTL